MFNLDPDERLAFDAVSNAELPWDAVDADAVGRQRHPCDPTSALKGGTGDGYAVLADSGDDDGWGSPRPVCRHDI